MTPPSTLTAPLNTRLPAARRELRRARLAWYRADGEPPIVEDLEGDEAGLVEDLFARAADSCALPPIAVREIVENLVHADFMGACVSVLDGGATLRVSDCGPGIADRERALQPGFSTACEQLRGLVRGVGSGLPVAAAAMEAVGGSLSLDDNLRGGTVVTLSRPCAGENGSSQELSDHARHLLALLVEVGSAPPDVLADELALPLASCGRELVLLEHRGLVGRRSDGARTLTPAGTELVSTLF